MRNLEMRMFNMSKSLLKMDISKNFDGFLVVKFEGQIFRRRFMFYLFLYGDEL